MEQIVIEYKENLLKKYIAGGEKKVDKYRLISLISFTISLVGFFSLFMIVLYMKRIEVEAVATTYLIIMSAPLLGRIFLIIGVITISAFVIFLLSCLSMGSDEE